MFGYCVLFFFCGNCKTKMFKAKMFQKQSKSFCRFINVNIIFCYYHSAFSVMAAYHRKMWLRTILVVETPLTVCFKGRSCYTKLFRVFTDSRPAFRYFLFSIQFVIPCLGFVSYEVNSHIVSPSFGKLLFLLFLHYLCKEFSQL